MQDDLFKLHVQNAINDLPEEFGNKLDNVSVLVTDYPTREQLYRSGGTNRLLLGLYEGIPQIKRGRYGYGGPLPDRITLFKKNIIYYSSMRKQDIEQTITDVFLHEIAHHFGMSEEEISNALK